MLQFLPKSVIIYLGIYFIIELTLDGCLLHFANSILYKVESALTRKMGFFTYKKALNLPAVAFEKTSSGEIINRITNDADTLSFAFGRLLNMFSSFYGVAGVETDLFVNSIIPPL